MMSRTLFYLCSCSFFFCAQMHAENVVWKGDVSSNGSPTHAIPLVMHKRYQIKVNGFVNLGKWVQNGEQLASDACYEYNAEKPTSKQESLKNSMEISVCDGQYHANHQYQSQPFVAEKNRIHFWVEDEDYEDNVGSFQVQIIELSQ